MYYNFIHIFSLVCYFLLTDLLGVKLKLLVHQNHFHRGSNLIYKHMMLTDDIDMYYIYPERKKDLQTLFASQHPFHITNSSLISV